MNEKNTQEPIVRVVSDTQFDVEYNGIFELSFNNLRDACCYATRTFGVVPLVKDIPYIY